MKKILLALLLIGILFGNFALADETCNGKVWKSCSSGLKFFCPVSGNPSCVNPTKQVTNTNSDQSVSYLLEKVSNLTDRILRLENLILTLQEKILKIEGKSISSQSNISVNTGKGIYFKAYFDSVNVFSESKPKTVKEGQAVTYKIISKWSDGTVFANKNVTVCYQNVATRTEMREKCEQLITDDNGIVSVTFYPATAWGPMTYSCADRQPRTIDFKINVTDGIDTYSSYVVVSTSLGNDPRFLELKCN